MILVLFAAGISTGNTILELAKTGSSDKTVTAPWVSQSWRRTQKLRDVTVNMGARRFIGKPQGD